MALSGPTVKFDLYRAGNGLPAAPDVANCVGMLVGRFRNLKTVVEYDHILLVELDLDIRYTDNTGAVPGDDVYFPNKNCLTDGGSRMKVWFVEVLGMGTGSAMKAAYLKRDVVQWPTNYL